MAIQNSLNLIQTGIIAADGNGDFDGRTLTAGTGISISNGDGTGGNPTISGSAVVPISFPTDAGTATPAASALTISGGTGINTSGAGAAVTVNLDVPVLVASGGTGATSLTDGGIILGSGTGAVTVTAQPTNGQILMGSTGVDPVLNTLTDGTGIVITEGAGSITVGLDVEARVALSTGLITGGILSVGTPPNKFSISDGNGVIVDCTTDPAVPTVTAVSWSGKTDIIVTGIAAQLITFILIDNTGTVIQQSTAPTQAQRRTHITLGVVVHVDLINVDAVNNEQQTCINPGAQLYDLMDGLGFFNVSGNVFSPNAAANLTFDKSVGKIVKAGSNWNISPQNPHILLLASLTIASFQYRFQGGTNGVTGTTIDPDIYDIAGVSTPVPNSKYTIQRIYSFISNNVKIQPGQALYNSLAEAKASIQIESFTTEPSILANGLLRGFLCIKKGATDLTDASEAFFISAGKFGGTSGIGGLSVSTLQNAYDNSIDPEIVINSTNGALSIQDAAVPIGANLFEVQSNGAGSTFFNVTTSGADIDGALTLTTDLAVDHGGSARSTATAYSVICGGTTATAAHQSVASVGTAGQALLSNGAAALPSFQNVPGGSGITYLATATAPGGAGVASLEFTSQINSTYNSYYFIFENIICVNSGGLALLARTSSTGGSPYDSGASDYAINWNYTNGPGFTGAASFNSSYIIMGLYAGDLSYQSINGFAKVLNCSASKYTQIFSEGRGTSAVNVTRQYTTSGMRKQESPVTAISFDVGTGNIKSGTIKMYGMTTPT